jgi:hypothetical protein
MSGQIILHIGTEKTGSTTIQEGIRANALLLRESGVHPIFPMPTSLQGLSKRLDTLQDEARALPSDSDILVSGELFQSRLKSVNEVQILKEFLLSVFPRHDRFTVIVYLRRQAAIANSMVSTAAIFGVDFQQSPLSEYVRHICNHRKTKKMWSHVFGEASLIPRLFEITSRKSDLFTDFITTLGLASASVVKPTMSNVSLSHDGILTARAVHRYLKLQTELGRFGNKLARKIGADICKNVIRLADSGPKFLLHPEIWRFFDEEYAEMNKELKRTSFPKADHEYLFDRSISHEKPSFPSITDQEATARAIEASESYLASIGL